MWLAIVLTFLAAYLLGNLNGAVCMSNLVAHEDVRSHGSGNAGLTNFIRNYGAAKGLSVVAIDGGKATISCLVGGLLLEPYGMYDEGMAIGGAAVILGHVFPILLGFRGGKGVLSGLFVALTIDWRIAVLILVVFALAYALTQYVSLGSVLGAAAFVIIMHRGNVCRLVKGEERKTNLFGKGRTQ